VSKLFPYLSEFSALTVEWWMDTFNGSDFLNRVISRYSFMIVHVFFVLEICQLNSYCNSINWVCFAFQSCIHLLQSQITHRVQKRHPIVFSCITLRKSNHIRTKILDKLANENADGNSIKIICIILTYSLLAAMSTGRHKSVVTAMRFTVDDEHLIKWM